MAPTSQMDIPHVAPQPRMSLASILAIQKMVQGVPGDLLTRHQMADVMNLPYAPPPDDTVPQVLYVWDGDARVRTAIKYVEREHNVFWRWIKAKQAWECLSDEGKTDLAGDRVDSSARKARQAVHAASAVDASKLDSDTRRKLQRVSVKACIMAHAASRAATKVINETISSGGNLQVDKQAVLNMLRKPKDDEPKK